MLLNYVSFFYIYNEDSELHKKIIIRRYILLTACSQGGTAVSEAMLDFSLSKKVQSFNKMSVTRYTAS